LLHITQLLNYLFLEPFFLPTSPSLNPLQFATVGQQALQAAEFGICKQQHASMAKAGGRSDGAKQKQSKQQATKWPQMDGWTSRLHCCT
jgi:hypothetical protein